MESVELRIDRAVQRLEARAKAARQLQTILKEFPDILDEILGTDPSSATVTSTSQSDIADEPPMRQRLTAFQKVAGVFLGNGNEWTDTSEVVLTSGVARNVAATVMWSAHRDQFDRKPHPTHKRMKQWKLTAEAYDEMMKQNRLFEG